MSHRTCNKCGKSVEETEDSIYAWEDLIPIPPLKKNPKKRALCKTCYWEGLK